VLVSQFHHDPSFGVAVEARDERGKVGNVVQDVVAHHHSSPRSVGGDVGPPPRDLGVAHPALLGITCEDVEHGLAIVDGDDEPGRWRQGKAGRAAAGSDLEHRPARGNQFPGAPPRRGGFGSSASSASTRCDTSADRPRSFWRLSQWSWPVIP
jgi:hypothetical protein